MSEFDPPAILDAFNAAGVLYVMIGGLAVIAHGYVRSTEDTDVVVEPGAENRRRMVRALEALGATRPDGAPFDPHTWAEEANLRVMTPYGPLDILHEGVGPLSFTAVSDDATTIELDGVSIPVAGLRSLVAFKRLAGRPQDRADLAALEAAKGPLPIVAVPGLDDAPA